MKLSPKTTLRLISWWPPYLFSGIKVKSFDKSLSNITIQLKSSLWNQNYFGTHFGGSLYSMCDPFFVFMLVEKLGKGYIVWDKSAQIDFLKATSDPVFAEFKISDEEAQGIREEVEKKYKFEPQFEVQIKDSQGNVVAKIRKTLYVRKKSRKVEK